MNKYKISDVFVGMKERFTHTITEEMMQKFYEITSDENPLHLDRTFAESKGFSNMMDTKFLSGFGVSAQLSVTGLLAARITRATMLL